MTAGLSRDAWLRLAALANRARAYPDTLHNLAHAICDLARWPEKHTEILDDLQRVIDGQREERHIP